MSLGVSSGSTKKVKYFGFFGGEVVFINTELSSDLDSLVLKGRVYPVGQWLGVRELNRF